MNTCCNNIYPDEDLKRWETSCSVPYYTKSEIDEIIEEITISGGGITSGEVQTQIDASVEPIEGSVEALSGAVGQLSTDLENKADKSDIPSLDNYYDKDEVNTIIEDNEYAISQAINDLNDRKLDASAYTPVDMSGYWTSGETQEAINAATSGTPSSATIERLRTDVNALSGDVTNLYETKLDASAYTPTDLSNYYNKSEVNSLLDDKLDASAYTPTDLSQYWTSAQTQSAITQATSGYATQQWVENKHYLTEHQSLSGYATTATTTSISNVLTSHTSNATIHVTQSEKNTWNSKADASNTYTKTEVNNIVNNKFACMTQSEYEALTNKDNNVLYLIHE